MTLDGLLLASLIFVMRVANYAISTIRLVAITRDKKLVAASLAFIEAFVFAVVIAEVVNDLDQIINLVAYCLGASVGSWVGMLLESRFITSYRIVNIITPDKGQEIAQAIRSAGYGVTSSEGEGRDGTVTTLRSIVTNRQVPSLIEIARDLEPDVFISIEEARAVQRGWVRQPGGYPK